MLDFNDPVGPNDITSVREVPLDNGNTLFLKRTNPYGFFVFSLGKGQLPEWMRGTYTSLIEAQKAMKQYLELKKFEDSKSLELVSAKADKKKV